MSSIPLHGLTVIKLGGSVLTDKSKPYSLMEERINRIGRELWEVFERMIIVHGVGSFGHPPVKKYHLYRGYESEEDLINLAHTQSLVFILRTKLADALRSQGIPAMIFLPSSFIVADNGKIKRFYTEPIEKFLNLGMVPLIGGDMVYDESMGFSVCSGDTIALHLAATLNARRLIFVSDVDGIYTEDPKMNVNAQPIREMDLEDVQNIAKVSGSLGIDVTSGMKGKIEELKSYVHLLGDTEIVFLSMLQYGNLKKYALGKDVKFTRVKIKNRRV